MNGLDDGARIVAGFLGLVPRAIDDIGIQHHHQHAFDLVIGGFVRPHAHRIPVAAAVGDFAFDRFVRYR